MIRMVIGAAAAVWLIVLWSNMTTKPTPHGASAVIDWGKTGKIE